MEFKNIKKDGTIVDAEDIKYSPDELSNAFLKGLVNSDVTVLEFKRIETGKVFLKVVINEKEYVLKVLLRNITNAGWKEKLDMKRIQVPNLELDITEFLEFRVPVYHLIVGMYNFDDNPIFVAWDANRHLNKETIRSFYVNIDTLLEGYNKEYFTEDYASQKIWVFKNNKFKEYITDYCSYYDKICGNF